MKIDWKQLRANIPSKIKTKYKTSFDVLWQDNLVDSSGKYLYGITKFNPNQIIINTQQSDKEAVLTLFHEVIHAMDDSYEVGLTENNVMKLEKSFLYIKELFHILEGNK